MHYAATRWIDVLYCKMKYPDYVDNEFNQGRLRYVWGVKSAIDTRFSEPNMYTLNDIQVTYDRKNELYFFHVETSGSYTDKKEEAAFLLTLLYSFELFMKTNNYSTEYQKKFSFSLPSVSNYARSIEELYINFKLYAEGYYSVYGGSEKIGSFL